MLIRLILLCLFGSMHCWCPDSNGVCACRGECGSPYGDSTITCIIDGIIPSFQSGNNTGQGTCYWGTVNLIINSIPVLNASIFNPGFAISKLNIHQNSTDPIPFDTQPFMSNLNKGNIVTFVTVTSLSGPLPFAAFDIDQVIWLSFDGSFTIDKPLPLWKYPSSLGWLALNSSVYSDLPSNVFENLQCQEYTIDIYNLTVIKSNMFNKIRKLKLCNVKRIKSFAVNNSNIDMYVNRDGCTKEASVSVIEAHAFHNTKIYDRYIDDGMFITVSADSEIHDQCFDTRSIGYGAELDLKIIIETNSTIRCDSIGHLTKYFKDLTITVETSTPGLSISGAVCGDESNLKGVDISYDGNCPDAECIVKLDQISSFPLVTQLRLYGLDESNIDINLTTHFANLSQLKYKDVCDDSLLTLPSPSTIDLHYLDKYMDRLRLVFRANYLSYLNLRHILQSTQSIECSCSISWMIQLRDCHSNKSDTSVDEYLSNVQCSNKIGTVMEYLLNDTCCEYTTEKPTPIPNCNGYHTLPASVLTFDHGDLPQCKSNKQWRFDPCDVQMFYDNPLATRQPPTTSTTPLAYYLPAIIGIILVICAVSVAYAIYRRRRSIITQRTNTEVNAPSDSTQNQLYGQHSITHNEGQIANNNHTFVGDGDVVRYVAGRDYVLSPLSTDEYDNTLGNEYNNLVVHDDMDQSTSNADRNN